MQIQSFGEDVGIATNRKIVVVADDFTGAAELAGIGHRYGLETEVHTRFHPQAEAELVCLDLGTRSGTASEAENKVRHLTHALRERRVELIFKKTDSVLRGHVLAELEALLEGLSRPRALLVPANPSAGRTISQGRYWIHGRPLHETDFARDPEYPARTSDVLGLLGSSRMPTSVCKPDDELPERGIVVGEATAPEQVRVWAARVSAEMVPAGGAEFFEAVLRDRGLSQARHSTAPAADVWEERGVLFVFGSSSGNSRRFLAQLRARGFPASCLPCDLSREDALSDGCLQAWYEASLGVLEREGRVVVAVDQPVKNAPGLPVRLADFTARLVEKLVHATRLAELVIEGGATASAVLARLDWQRFAVVQEFAPGVVRMRVVGRQEHVTVKPGSYPWELGVGYWV